MPHPTLLLTTLAGWTVAVLSSLAPAPLGADEAAYDEGRFRACVAVLGERARTAGVRASTVDRVLEGISYRPRVIELDRSQPEFTRSFAEYYAARVTKGRVERGRVLLAEHRELLRHTQQRYGIPAHYLLAFWGLETNFGAYYGDIPVPESLATLACDERRGAFFGEQFVAALRIVDAGDVGVEAMRGSWAGAMGNFQFLPSVFLGHAVDADGDGRRDLWASVPDSLASAGNYLASLGWEKGLRWGREIRLPQGFDYSVAGRDVRKPLREWVDLGVTDAYGGALPRLDLPASVLVPSGHAGPAFIVYENFDVIMRWNRSEFYALSVGRLADRIAGAGGLVRPPPSSDVGLSRDAVLRLQVRLAELGFDPGAADGLPGPATRRAVQAFQRKRGLVADGHIDAALLAAVE